MTRVCDDARIEWHGKISLVALFIEKANHGQYCKRRHHTDRS